MTALRLVGAVLGLASLLAGALAALAVGRAIGPDTAPPLGPVGDAPTATGSPAAPERPDATASPGGSAPAKGRRPARRARPVSPLARGGLAPLLAAVRREAGAGARMVDMDLRLDRASFAVVRGKRVLTLSFDTAARVTGRGVRDRGPADERPLPLARVPRDLVGRMLAAGRPRTGRIPRSRIAYVLYSWALVPSPGAGLVKRSAFALYVGGGGGARYFTTDLNGRRVLSAYGF